MSTIYAKKRNGQCSLEFSLTRTYGRNRYYPENGYARALLLISGRVCLEIPALRELFLAGFPILVNGKPFIPAAEESV